MLKVGSFFLMVFLLISCSDKEDRSYMNSLNGVWQKKQKQEFQFNINNAEILKNIIFVVRNSNEYPYSNIRLIVDLEGPKNIKQTDTLNYVLAKPNGEWLGTGFGNTKETLFQYKLNYKFPVNGKYKINIIQAMRRDLLPGIEDIGIKIESAKP